MRAGIGLLRDSVLLGSLLAFTGCLLLNPLDSLQSGAEDSGAPDGGPSAEASSPEGSVPRVIDSCKALKAAAPDTPDGAQTIDPDGPGPTAAFTAFCDMTTDGGGWMLVTDALATDETANFTTAQRRLTARGGVELRVYMNSQGCTVGPRARHRIHLANGVPWSQVRFRQRFAGNASCWHIFGGLQQDALPANLVPFDPFLDTIRDAVRMGGAAGDAFDGYTARCDEAKENFWLFAGPERSAEVILRRADPALPAGLSTGAECGPAAPGTTGTTWWEYADIYVR